MLVFLLFASVLMGGVHGLGHFRSDYESWRVVVVTANETRAGTNGNIAINVHGLAGWQSSMTDLKPNKFSLYEMGQRDDFVVDFRRIEGPWRVCIRLHGGGRGIDWKLDQVGIEPLEHSDECKYVSNFYVWFRAYQPRNYMCAGRPICVKNKTWDQIFSKYTKTPLNKSE